VEVYDRLGKLNRIKRSRNYMATWLGVFWVNTNKSTECVWKIQPLDTFNRWCP
jgi:hypothetical protein